MREARRASVSRYERVPSARAVVDDDELVAVVRVCASTLSRQRRVKREVVERDDDDARARLGRPRRSRERAPAGRGPAAIVSSEQA